MFYDGELFLELQHVCTTLKHDFILKIVEKPLSL